eukprot:CAMPEP_0113829516 /NCGR_PEP_ID=MMETSP0328-20130328/5840_1 /TAXON_ID=39455 /ORGANISM="Alexandrium minutum" /LENGTH=87 /DNA_ID=CAMNT_0000797573 /DNA_START=311 /DNA_END=570 /DNA_ORIENTATION=- /assembly_acc=CAM_ASM_000350
MWQVRGEAGPEAPRGHVGEGPEERQDPPEARPSALSSKAGKSTGTGAQAGPSGRCPGCKSPCSWPNARSSDSTRGWGPGSRTPWSSR